MSLGAILSLLFFIAANAITPQLFRWGIDEGIAKKDLQVVFLVGGLLVAKLARRKSFAFGRKDIVQANQKQCLEHSTTHTKKRSHLNSSCEEDSL
jgi:ATP-binding cassette subfamily B protein